MNLETNVASTENDKESLGDILGDIKSDLKVLAEKSDQKVSPEFTALMDGYVSKANESETLRVKYQHVENHFEELKMELKSQKTSGRQLGADLDSAREALKLSELDLSKAKKELEQAKKDFQDKIDLMNSEKDTLTRKIKELNSWKDNTENLCGEMKNEIIEYKHSIKQLQQENQIEKQTAERTLRESNRIVQELKEQLELREREASYKNALIEQLVRQTANGSGAASINDIASVLKGMQSSNPAPTGSEASISTEMADDSSDEAKKSFKWGAFRL